MFLGYNTNGLAHHRLFDAIELLAEIGYRGVAITIDHNALSPNDRDVGVQLETTRKLLDRHGMRSIIETGSRFLLDPRRKHYPTLISESAEGRRRRIDFYRHAIDCAAALGSDGVSIWSGASDMDAQRVDARYKNPLLPAEKTQQSPEAVNIMDRLVAGLRETLDYAAAKNVTLAFEPEPGMWIDTLDAYDALLRRIDAPNFGLTLDIGHLHCQGETPIVERIGRWASRLVNVHLEDMRVGRHEHLMFGEGEIDFPPIVRSLAASGYAAGVYVELSRHSREGPAAARRAFEFLSPLHATWTTQ